MLILFQYRNIRHRLGMYITKQAEQEIYLIAQKKLRWCELSGTSRNIMGDFDLSGTAPVLYSNHSLFICIREKRKIFTVKCNLCPGDMRLSTALDSTSICYANTNR